MCIVLFKEVLIGILGWLKQRRLGYLVVKTLFTLLRGNSDIFIKRFCVLV